MEIKIAQDSWDGEQEASIVSWIYADGAAVSEGEAICELLVEKIEIEITAPKSGKLKIGKQAEELVNKGDILGVIE